MIRLCRNGVLAAATSVGLALLLSIAPAAAAKPTSHSAAPASRPQAVPWAGAPNSDGLSLSPASSTLVPYGAAGYRYATVDYDDLQGFEDPAFDDVAAGFTFGAAAFANGTCGGPFQTSWTGVNDLLVRKEVVVPSGTSDVAVSIAIDNDVQVFWNGVDVSAGMVASEGCAVQDEYTFVVPNALLVGGENLLAVRARNRHLSSAQHLDIQVNATVPNEPPTALFVHGWNGSFRADEVGFFPLLDPLRSAYPGRVVEFEHFQDLGRRQGDGSCLQPRPIPMPDEPTQGMPITLGGTELTQCDSQGDIGLNAVALHHDVRDIYVATGGKVVVIANSGGAPIARGLLSYSDARGDGLVRQAVDSMVLLEPAADGAWAANAAGAADNVVQFLFGQETNFQLARPASVDLAPVSDWYQWANPRALPDVPYFNVFGDISLVTIDCPWFSDECREVEREKWGDTIMNTGTDDPFDVPAGGGARFLHGALGPQNWQWALTVDLQRGPFSLSPNRIDVFANPVSHWNFNAQIGNIQTTDCMTGAAVAVADALLNVIEGRMNQEPYECEP